MDRFRHQQEAFDRYKDASCIPIFFDPGLGKTRTVIDIACYKYNKGDIDSVIVIAPNGVHEQWAREEIPRWAEGTPHDIWIKTDKRPPAEWEKRKSLKFLCVNVDRFSTPTSWRWYVDYAREHRTFIVVDEATRIKNPDAKRTKNIMYGFNDVVFRGRTIVKNKPFTVARAVLTGTPVTNRPFDVWAMFEFLQPGCTGRNWYTFQSHFGLWRTMVQGNRQFRVLITEDIWNAVKYCNSFEVANSVFGIGYDDFCKIKKQEKYEGCYDNLPELKAWLYERAIFANIEECFDMPEKIYVQRRLDMSKEQLAAYKAMKSEFIAEYGDTSTSVTTQLACSIRLKQIASGFMVPDEKFDEDPDPGDVTWFKEVPKMKRILSDIDEIKGRCVVVTTFTAEAYRLYDELIKEGYSVCLQTGSKRIGTIEDFKNGKYQIMIANIRIISMGFNLQAVCHHILFYSNTYSFEDRRQTEGRIYRANQHDKCIFMDYVMNGSVDEDILQAQKDKKSMSEYIKDKGGLYGKVI